jgi:NAD(P)-dependent dehydrogenase (short-subunit alcohol dehydrogenase family)
VTKSLQEKAIVITGSGRGIGAAVAKLAASLGAKIVVNDVDAAVGEETGAAIRASGGTAVFQAANIANWAEAKVLIDRCVKEWGRIDGLMNNAGLFRLARLEEETEANVRSMMEVNVIGTMACAAHAIHYMKKQGKGSIVNVTSGSHMGLPAMGAYGASKGAVASMTYTWAVENAGTGIRVNALSPMAATRMMEENDRYYGDKRVSSLVPVPPEANAPLVCYLLSDLSEGVNGQIVRSEGRQLALVAHPGVALPLHENDNWTVESIDKVFRDDLGKRQFPLGVVGLKVEVAGAGSAAWGAGGGKDTGKR